jgi:signal transduction histidine kinase/ActR/RegA family two-component response regulator
MRARWLPAVIDGRRLAGFAVATFVAHALSLLLIRFGGPLAPAWPPVGFALAALLYFPRDHRPLLLIGYAVIDIGSHLLQGYATITALAYLVVGLAELLLADIMLRRVAELPLRMARVREVFLLLGATAVAAALTSLPAAAIATKFGGGQFANSAVVWWVGDMIAYAIITPLTLLLLDPPTTRLPTRTRPWWAAEAVVISVVVLVLSTYGYREQTLAFGIDARPYMLMAPLLWATLRFGQIGALLTVLESAAVGVAILTASSSLDLWAYSMERSLLVLQVFLLVISVTSLVLATALREQHDTARHNARMVDALQASEQRLRQSQKMEAIGQLAGGVAHDFNNVLAAIMMQLEELRLVRDMPRIGRELIIDVETSVQRAARLTRQLLVFSRQQAMQPQLLDLNALVRSHVRLLRRVVPSTHDLTVACHPGALVVHADGGMIEQVLLNLVLNARDAQPGGGTIAIVTAARTLATNEADLAAGPYTVLTVRDTGSGIDPEHLPRLFEPFFTTKAPGQGTGLGLATAYGIVQQHQGTVRVTSHVGHGTSMEVWIPLSSEPLPPDTVLDVDSGDGDDARTVTATTTILVVEDEETVRRLLQRVLEREGYAVLTAATGREALDWWPSGGGEVDLVITDLVMPGGISGAELGRELRRLRAGLPVVYTSGYDPEYNPADVTMVPGENFIPKPATAEQIVSVVRRQLLARLG